MFLHIFHMRSDIFLSVGFKWKQKRWLDRVPQRDKYKEMSEFVLRYCSFHCFFLHTLTLPYTGMRAHTHTRTHAGARSFSHSWVWRSYMQHAKPMLSHVIRQNQGVEDEIISAFLKEKIKIFATDKRLVGISEPFPAITVINSFRLFRKPKFTLTAVVNGQSDGWACSDASNLLKADFHCN